MIGLRSNVSRIVPMAARSARQRECDADEAGWELQIRRMAKHGTRQIEPPVTVPAAATTQIMEVVSKIGRHDVLLLPRTLPIGTGDDPEDLACGRCSTIVAAGLSRTAARNRHPEGKRVVVRCTCKALNLLCGVARGSRKAGRRAGSSLPAPSAA
jgi:hypothetical protein